VPTRQRRPAFAALALVLILGGAALAALLVVNSSKKISVLVLVRDVPPGHVFVREDFAEAQVSATSELQPVRVASLGQLTNGNYTARTGITAGSLMTRNMYAVGAPIPGKGFAAVPLSIPVGQYPQGLQAGDIVKVVYTPKTGAGQNAVNLGPPDKPSVALPAGTDLIDKALVTDVGTIGEGDRVLNVTIVVLNENNNDGLKTSGSAVAQAANAVGAISLARLPDSTAVETGAGN
jgi:hypothetical protein